MEVVDPTNMLLTNQEVLTLLKEVKARPQPGKRSRNHATIVHETMKYLSTSPAAAQNRQHIEKLILSVEKFKLFPFEIMQLINLRPSTQVELQLLIEEAEERLTVDQVDELLKMIKNCLPPQKKEN
uniref:DNA-directed RNA polymerase III subunit RPC9 n=1 Tax=Acrobeloides nanus TaxID=290746 RepID=A0A914C280_9BILA